MRYTQHTTYVHTYSRCTHKNTSPVFASITQVITYLQTKRLSSNLCPSRIIFTVKFHIILFEWRLVLLIHPMCFIFSLGLTCLRQLMIICGSTFVPLAPFLENDIWNCNQTKQEQKDMITLKTNLILGPNKQKRKRGRLHAQS